MNYKTLFHLFISLALLSACSGNNSAATTTDVQPIKYTVPVAESAIKNLFEEKCAACHGKDGTAGIADAANLRLCQLNPAAIIQTITNGKKAMPPFKGQLTKQQINELTNYAFTLRK
jgi:cytochrome c6